MIDYQLCLEYQQRIHLEVVSGERQDTLLLCSHPPTITMGTSTKLEHLTTPVPELEKRNLTPITISRGGSVTYHGPEQLIAYPILNLKRLKTDVGWYMRSLEDVVINTLRNKSVTGFRIEGKTGVWVRENAKIAFIGVKISRWCTYHGISLNVFSCSDKFSLINPCGLGDIQVTYIEEESSGKTSLQEAEDLFTKAFQDVFNSEVVC
jgi:lipoyl(octanoyl) transferase